MKDDLVDIFESETLALAQLLADRLAEAGIQAFIDNDDSPFDGLSAARQYKIVRVLSEDAEQAREIAEAFLKEQEDGEEDGEEQG